MKTVSHALPFLMAIAVLVFAGWRLYGLRERVPYHEDEHVYINRAVFFDLFRTGNFSHPLWRTFETDYSKLPDIVYGATLTLAQQTSVRAYLQRVGFNTDAGRRDTWNVTYSQQYVPMSQLPPAIYQRIEPVRVARTAAFWMTLGTLACVMVVGWVLDDWLMGFLAAGALALHPLFTHVMLTAMGDAPLMLFSLLALLMLTRWRTTRFQRKELFRWAGLAGLALGGAVSAKLNGLFSAVFAAGLSVTLLRDCPRPHASRALQAVLLMAGMCVFCLYVFTPQIWRHPVEGFVGMLRQRENTIHQQQLWFLADGLYTPIQRLEATSHWVFNWHDRYGNFPVRWTHVALFAFGLAVVVARAKRSQSAKLLLWWALCVGGLTALTVPLNWNRYFLPIILVVTLIQSAGISYLLQYACNISNPVAVKK